MEKKLVSIVTFVSILYTAFVSDLNQNPPLTRHSVVQNKGIGNHFQHPYLIAFYSIVHVSGLNSTTDGLKYTFMLGVLRNVGTLNDNNIIVQSSLKLQARVEV